MLMSRRPNTANLRCSWRSAEMTDSGLLLVDSGTSTFKIPCSIFKIQFGCLLLAAGVWQEIHGSDLIADSGLLLVDSGLQHSIFICSTFNIQTVAVSNVFNYASIRVCRESVVCPWCLRSGCRFCAYFDVIVIKKCECSIIIRFSSN